MNWNHTDNSPNYAAFVQNYSYGGTNNDGNLVSGSEWYSPGSAAVPYASLTAGASQSYSYDGVNRLSNVTDSSYARTFCYDAFGNGWVTAYSGVPSLPGNAPQEIGVACVAGGANPYSATNSLSTNNRLVGNSYDGAGNQTSYGGNAVIYDASNRVVFVNSGGERRDHSSQRSRPRWMRLSMTGTGTGS